MIALRNTLVVALIVAMVMQERARRIVAAWEADQLWLARNGIEDR